MKHVIIVAHPRLDSFTLAMAEAYAGRARETGDAVLVRDLYRMDFDPLLHAAELPDHDGFAPRAEVVGERAAIADADIFVLVYPLWFNAAPALLKGYVDRIFTMGFGYSPQSHGGNHPLLGGRKLVSFSCSGAPQHWVESSGAWDAMLAHFDRHLCAVTGMEFVGHHNLGGIVPGLRADVANAHLETVRGHASTIVEAYR